MSKSSLIVGVVLSAVIHAVFLLPALAQRNSAQADEAVPVPPVVVVPPEPEPPEPVPIENVPEIEPPPPEPIAEQVEMAEVVTPPEPEAEETPGNTDAEATADDEKLLPATRIIWESPQQLARVARTLRMRVVAVDEQGDVAGEVALWGEPGIKEFGGRLDVYSNRVRSIPLSFFGDSLPLAPEMDVVGFLVLVPEEVDRQMAETVRGAVRAKGLSAADVEWVEAAFDEGALGGARFVVIEVHALARGE
jgi:hypothetical protein